MFLVDAHCFKYLFYSLFSLVEFVANVCEEMHPKRIVPVALVWCGAVLCCLAFLGTFLRQYQGFPHSAIPFGFWVSLGTRSIAVSFRFVSEAAPGGNREAASAVRPVVLARSDRSFRRVTAGESAGTTASASSERRSRR